jgi:HPt (histidine-containing phosphotransfer) domain-containing protein
MEVFDREIGLRHTNGDEELLKKRCQAYCESAQAKVETLDHAVTEKDAESVALLASELKTVSLEVGAAGMENLASLLEDAVRATDWNEVSGLVTKLSMELGWFQRIIDENVCSGNL